MKNIPIGEVLQQYGYITEEQIHQALDYQKEHPGKRLGTILMELEFITEQQMLEALGQRLSLSHINLGSYPVNSEAVEKIPKQLAVKYNILALDIKDNQLYRSQ